MFGELFLAHSVSVFVVTKSFCMTRAMSRIENEVPIHYFEDSEDCVENAERQSEK